MSKSTIGSKLLNYIDVILLFIICTGMFSYLIQQPSSDIAVHMKQIQHINIYDVSYPANFLFYFIVNLCAGFTNGKLLYVVTVVLLSLACIGKYLISKYFIISFNLQFNHSVLNNKTLLVSTLALFFCFAIPDPFSIFVLKKMYISKFVPLVWHNSTTIFLFPFAILLFWKQLQILDTKHKANINEIIALNTLVLINLLIKPSFIFTYAPVTFFFLWKKGHLNKNGLLKLSPFFTIGLVLTLQYYFIFVKQQGSFYNDVSKVMLGKPFEFMLNFVPAWFIPVSLIFSFAFILFAMMAYKEILNFTPFKYALTLTVVGIIISAFLIETGPRALHGNFIWQNVICTYLLFLTSVSYFVPRLLSQKVWFFKDKILAISSPAMTLTANIS